MSFASRVYFSRRNLGRCAAGIVAVVLLGPGVFAQGRGAANTVTVTQEHNGSTVTVPPRGTLVLRLPSNAATRYTWQAAPDSGKVLSPQGKPAYEEPKRGAIGSGGVQVFRFRAPASGAESTLRLRYVRPFEPDAPPAETFSLTVRVGSSGDGGRSVTATVEQNNQTVQVPAGGTLLVRLPSNRTTGFTWQLARNDAKGLMPVGPPDYESPPAGQIGAGGFQVFRFQAAGAAGSEATLQLNYLQPFDKRTPPAETYRLTVRITGEK